MKIKAKITAPVMTKKQQLAASKKAKDDGECEILVCIDARTGMLKILGKGEKCPPGYLRKVDSAVQKGIMFNPETLEQ